MDKKFYITTTLPYVNADPHLGFALEIIQADVLARYYRQQGYEVFFNTGVDEHGLKVFRRAQEQNLTPQAYCDIYAEKYKKLKQVLNLSYDSFIRTTDSNHIKAAQEFWHRCKENGDIYKKDYKVKYCVGCELEKTESELVNNRCPIHPNLELEIIEEENYFFRYSKYRDQLLRLYRDNPQFVFPEQRLNEIEKFTSKGLKDFSISRLKQKLPWGISVPDDKEHVMFVWFDALINYISCLGWPKDTKKFNNFWPGLQTAGKDNLRQQSSMWQAMLMSAGLPASKQIFIHGFITSGGQKMSKSLGNVVDPFTLIKKYGVDAVRYFLLREISPTEDGDFTEEKFRERFNADLAKGLGNLVARVVTLASRFKVTSQKSNFEKEIDKVKDDYRMTVTEFKFNEALSSVWGLIGFCDKYVEKEKLWEEKEENKDKIAGLLFVIGEIAGLLLPFLPETAEKISEQLKSKESKALFPRLD